MVWVEEGEYWRGRGLPSDWTHPCICCNMILIDTSTLIGDWTHPCICCNIILIDNSTLIGDWTHPCIPASRLRVAGQSSAEKPPRTRADSRKRRVPKHESAPSVAPDAVATPANATVGPAYISAGDEAGVETYDKMSAVRKQARHPLGRGRQRRHLWTSKTRLYHSRHLSSRQRAYTPAPTPPPLSSPPHHSHRPRPLSSVP